MTHESKDLWLSSNQVEYVLAHFEMCWNVSCDVRELIWYGPIDDEDSKHIVVPKSASPFDVAKVIEVEGSWVLFPTEDVKSHVVPREGSIVFTHDIFRSIFFVLSGQYELDVRDRDRYGRVPYHSTFFSALNTLHRPIVNEMYDVLAQAVQLAMPRVTVRRKRLASSFVFLLTHDIDVVSKFNHYLLRSRLKKFDFGYIWNWLRYWTMSEEKRLAYDPYWTFDLLGQLSDQYNLRSTYFFLPQGDGPKDARYDMTSPRLRSVISQLVNRGDEVQLHGTMASYQDQDEMLRNVRLLEEVKGSSVEGIRQHRLCYDEHCTPSIHSHSGISYDATLGFAEQEGWRRGFCFPSRPYNHRDDCSYDHWSIPLTVMDATYYHYQDFDVDSAKKSFSTLIDEVSRYGGVLSLLWHNSSLDDDQIESVSLMYRDLLKIAKGSMATSLTCSQLINQVDEA